MADNFPLAREPGRAIETIEAKVFVRVRETEFLI